MSGSMQNNSGMLKIAAVIAVLLPLRANGLIGTCPIYSLLGINTCPLARR